MKIIVICLLLISFSNYSQSTSSNLSKDLLEKTVYDTSTINLLNKISKKQCTLGEFDKTILYAKKALLESDKIGYTKGIYQAYKNIGLAYKFYGENEKALFYFQKLLALSNKMKNDRIRADALGLIGLIYEGEDKYESALSKFIEQLNISERIGYKNGISRAYNCIGIIHSNLNHLNKAKEYFFKSLKFGSKDDLSGIAATYNNIGIAYADEGEYASAIRMHRKSLALEKRLQDKNAMALSYNNIGLCYRTLNKLDSASFYHKKAFQLNSEMKNKKGIALSSFNVGKDFLELNEIDSANLYASISLKNSIKINSLYIQQGAYQLLCEIQKKTHDYKKALDYLELNKKINDTLYDLESQKKIAELNAKYESEKKDKELIQFEKQKKVKQLEIDNQKSQTQILIIILLSLLVIITILVLFTILINRTSKKLSKSNQLLVKRNFEIELKKEEINSQAIQIAKYQSQMNPHFIFNAINGLQGLILDGDKLTAVNHIHAFAKLLRLTLNNSENDLLSIQDEIDYLNKYVEFELLTFSKKFKFIIFVDENIDRSLKIPTMLIQPMVENAIKYAELERFDNSEISVNFHLTELNGIDYLKILIKDNGIGIQKSKSSHTSKGISITKHRINLELKRINSVMSDYFIIQSPATSSLTNPGTLISMVLPYIK